MTCIKMFPIRLLYRFGLDHELIAFGLSVPLLFKQHGQRGHKALLALHLRGRLGRSRN